MVPPADPPATVPIDPEFVVCEGVLVGMELILLVAVDELAVGVDFMLEAIVVFELVITEELLSVNGIESVI